MSFAGGPGHRSPFTERAKTTKSHLSPRRTSTTASGTSRGPQQSLFSKESSTFGGKPVSHLGDSSTKARNEVIKEPTTPTRASEGKGSRRDEFSIRRTPVKTTPRTAFGTVTPKRPYVGSPKYQKVLMERPAFYNTPTAAAGETDSGKKAVSISELQKRLKRFLQDENTPTARMNASSEDLEEVPGNISRSPRVNPLFHHDDTVLQVAKGGVAFTAGVDEEPCTHSMENDVEFTSGEAFFAMAPEATPLAPQSEEETERALGPEDFPVHSETEDEAVVPAEEIATSAIVQVPVEEAAPETVEAKAEEVHVDAPLDIVEEKAEEVHVEAPLEIVGEKAEEAVVEAALERVEEVDVEAEKETVGVATVEAEKEIVGVATVEAKAEAKAEVSVEEEVEVEEFEILESWSQRLLKFVVLAVMVACMMGLMVLASGSQGLLPKSMVGGQFVVTPSVIPVSVGFMGLGREHEGLPCLPSVHLGWQLLSTHASRNNAALHLESGVSSYQPIVHSVLDLDELKTVTDYYKELQGKLFSDVAGLTSECVDDDMDGASLEHVMETAAVEEVAAEVSASSEDASEVAASEEIMPSEDVAEVAAVEEIMPSEDVAESEATMEEISELVGDEVVGESEAASEETLIVESPQIILDAAAGPEIDVELPADMESDVLDVESDAAVPTSDFVPSETTEILSQTAEATPSVEERSIEEPTADDVAHSISDEVVVLPSITGEIATEESSVEDLVDEHLIEEPQSEGAVLIEETTCPSSPVSEVAVSEELILEENLAAEGSFPVASLGLIVVTLASAVALMAHMRKSPAAAAATEVKTAKNMGSPVAWPSSRSVFDSHVPDRDELDAITSPLKAPKSRYSSFYGAAEPALSAPLGVFKAPAARVVVQKPATTWHPAMNGGSTISGSSYRQTASYVPSFPSQSGISSSTRGASSDTDSICESALTMGAEEWEHLGSFTTTEVVSVVSEGGEQQKVRTPVRRSQRLRNRVSPLPVRFNDFS